MFPTVVNGSKAYQLLKSLISEGTVSSGLDMFSTTCVNIGIYHYNVITVITVAHITRFVPHDCLLIDMLPYFKECTTRAYTLHNT